MFELSALKIDASKTAAYCALCEMAGQMNGHEVALFARNMNLTPEQTVAALEAWAEHDEEAFVQYGNGKISFATWVNDAPFATFTYAMPAPNKPLALTFEDGYMSVSDADEDGTSFEVYSIAYPAGVGPVWERNYLWTDEDCDRLVDAVESAGFTVDSSIAAYDVTVRVDESA